MEKKYLIESVNYCPEATAQQIHDRVVLIRKNDLAELFLVPNPNNADQFMGILLAKFYTPALADHGACQNQHQEEDLLFLSVSRAGIRSYYMGLTRRMMQALHPEQQTQQEHNENDSFAPLNELLELARNAPAKSRSFDRHTSLSPAMRFLQSKTPAQIQQELDEQIIGQQELTKSVADFLYYHALRQVHPQLPQRPMMIAGPSGSGKTEVWRVAQKLYGDVFRIRVIDGSSITCDGWSGSHKLSTYVTKDFAKGGILVVDEFDKLTKPKHCSSGDNVSLDVQAEFLKLVEGEYHVVENRQETNITSKTMGFVFVGAFEDLRSQKETASVSSMHPIGFGAASVVTPSPVSCSRFTDEDFIAYGIMPEIIGRIATRSFTKALDEKAYLDIIYAPHSRVSQIQQVLEQYGIQASAVISAEEIQHLVASSKNNKTGVRWVCAQVETQLLEAIRTQGLFPAPAIAS